jgi:structural maintenance of chromosome 3 (chondroitin sulfate proteoglycan 6)
VQTMLRLKNRHLPSCNPFIQDLETEQTESKIKLSNLAVQSRQNTTQLEDLIRRRTELECLIDDVDQANQDGAGTREDREQELENIETRLVQVREELDQLGTQYEERVTQERQLRQESVLPIGVERLLDSHIRSLRCTQNRYSPRSTRSALRETRTIEPIRNSSRAGCPPSRGNRNSSDFAGRSTRSCRTDSR